MAAPGHLSLAEQLYGADLDRRITDLIPGDLREALNSLDMLPGRPYTTIFEKRDPVQ